MAIVAASPNSAKGRLPGERGSGLRAAAAREASGSRLRSLKRISVSSRKLSTTAVYSPASAARRSVCS